MYKVIDNLSIALANRGQITVCSIAPKPKKQIYQTSTYRHVQFKEHPLRFFLCDEFRKFLLSCPEDTIFHFHSVFIPWFLSAVRLLKQNGFKRVVLIPHGQYIDEAMNISLKKRVFFHFFDRKVIQTVDAVQLIGSTEKNRYITSNAKEFHLIPNGCVPSKAIVPVKNKLYFGYMGRLDMNQKGLDILCQAFGFYKKQGGNGLLLIAGDGQDKDNLEELCKSIGVADYVCFTGTVFGKEKNDFFNKCAYFIHSSRWDVLPTGCMEAAANGVPLVVSQETNLGMYIEKFNAGFAYVSDGRPVQALTETLFKAESLFRVTESYRECCESSMAMIAEELNWDCIAKSYMELLYHI